MSHLRAFAENTSRADSVQLRIETFDVMDEHLALLPPARMKHAMMILCDKNSFGLPQSFPGTQVMGQGPFWVFQGEESATAMFVQTFYCGQISCDRVIAHSIEMSGGDPRKALREFLGPQRDWWIDDTRNADVSCTREGCTVWGKMSNSGGLEVGVEGIFMFDDIKT